MENDYGMWDGYGVWAWPPQLLFDGNGRLQDTIVGDGQDEHVTAAVRAIVDKR